MRAVFRADPRKRFLQEIEHALAGLGGDVEPATIAERRLCEEVAPIERARRRRGVDVDLARPTPVTGAHRDVAEREAEMAGTLALLAVRRQQVERDLVRLGRLLEGEERPAFVAGALGVLERTAVSPARRK